jgi:hypothetical protein
MEQTVKLFSSKHGEKGEVRLRLVFNPMIVAKSRKQTSTFSNAGRAMTNIGTLPLNAGLGVFHGVTGAFKHKEQEEITSGPPSGPPSGQSPHAQTGSGVLHGVTNVFKPKEHQELNPVFPSDQSPHAVAVSNNHGPVGISTNGQPMVGEPGTLRVAVLDAKGLGPHDIKPYTAIRVGDKEFKTKHTAKTDTPEWLVMLYPQFNPELTWICLIGMTLSLSPCLLPHQIFLL